MMQLVASLDSSKLLNQFETGNASTAILMELLEDDCEGDEKEFRKLLKAEFDLITAEAKRLSSLIVQLKQAKDQLGSDFEELPFEAPSSSSQHTDQKEQDQPSLGQHEVIFQDIKINTRQLLSRLADRTCILKTAHDMRGDQEVVVKAFASLSGAERELANLRRLGRSSGGLVVSVVVSQVLESFWVEGERHFHGVVMEKGQQNLEQFLQAERDDLDFTQLHVMGKRLIAILDHFEQCGLVWNDCKLSNFVRFLTGNKFVLKAIDVEHAVEVGSSVCGEEDEEESKDQHQNDQYGFTTCYAAPEVLRWSYGQPRHAQLEASFLFDSWSLGVCLLELHTGRDLASHLRKNGTDARGVSQYVRYVLDTDNRQLDEDIRAKIDEVIEDDTADKRHLKSLLRKLLTTNVLSSGDLERLVDQEVDTMVEEGDGSDLKRLLKRMVREDLSNDDLLVEQVVEGVEARLGSADKASGKLLVQELVRLSTRRRLSIDKVVAHAYMTGKDGTTTVRGQKKREKVLSFLEDLTDSVEGLHLRMGTVDDRLEWMADQMSS